MDRFQNILEAENLCFLCLDSANYRCDKCDTPYCTPEHYNVHYDKEKDYCYPFRVLQKPEVGRYLVATRDINPLELILHDTPAIFGPNNLTSVPLCLECMVPVDGSFLCPKCELPLCSTKCLNGPNHKLECQVFSQDLTTGLKFKVNFDRPKLNDENGIKKIIVPEYCCITTLRGLELKKNNPSLWNRIQLLMDHDEDRKKEIDFNSNVSKQKVFENSDSPRKNSFLFLKINIVDFLIEKCGLDYTEDEIFRMIGIIKTNSVHVDYPTTINDVQVSGHVVYPTVSYISHNCISNARCSMAPRSSKNHEIKIYSKKNIEMGQEITIQYLPFLYGHFKRKKTIRSNWFFDCACQRCLDPMELNSMYSAMKCPDCIDASYMVPENPMDLDSDWKCKQCNVQQSAKMVEDYVEDCERMLANTSEDDVEKYEKLLEIFKETLHPDHHITMTVKKFLADSYGCMQGYKYNQLSEEKLNMKIMYYENYLDFIEKLNPGFTIWRGEVLYQLHYPLLFKANKAYESGNLKKDDFMTILREIKSSLEESHQCLKLEAEGTKEAQTAQMVTKALVGIKELLFFSDFL